ncbi:MAG TPA: PQ-loop domain-containing transporter [Candidatus Paceibacterota bacterium]|nr:PQ-loop domain-containing transporter [Candidatus Paceibacterota bacterium]
MITFIDFLSSAAIVIFIVSALPQVVKLVRQKTARDISLGMSVLIAVGNSLGLARAIAIGDTFFTVNYSFQLALWLVIVALIVKYKGR